MTQLVDVTLSKSVWSLATCGFESHLGHMMNYETYAKWLKNPSTRFDVLTKGWFANGYCPICRYEIRVCCYTKRMAKKSFKEKVQNHFEHHRLNK